MYICVLLCIVFFVYCQKVKTNYYLSPERGIDESNLCLNMSVPCKTFEHLFSSISTSDEDIGVVAEPGVYTIHDLVQFTGGDQNVDLDCLESYYCVLQFLNGGALKITTDGSISLGSFDINLDGELPPAGMEWGSSSVISLYSTNSWSRVIDCHFGNIQLSADNPHDNVPEVFVTADEIIECVISFCEIVPSSREIVFFKDVTTVHRNTIYANNAQESILFDLANPHMGSEATFTTTFNVTENVIHTNRMKNIFRITSGVTGDSFLSTGNTIWDNAVGGAIVSAVDTSIGSFSFKKTNFSNNEASEAIIEITAMNGDVVIPCEFWNSLLVHNNATALRIGGRVDAVLHFSTIQYNYVHSDYPKLAGVQCSKISGYGYGYGPSLTLRDNSLLRDNTYETVPSNVICPTQVNLTDWLCGWGDEESLREVCTTPNTTLVLMSHSDLVKDKGFCDIEKPCRTLDYAFKRAALHPTQDMTILLAGESVFNVPDFATYENRRVEIATTTTAKARISGNGFTLRIKSTQMLIVVNTLDATFDISQGMYNTHFQLNNNGLVIASTHVEACSFVDSQFVAFDFATMKNSSVFNNENPIVILGTENVLISDTLIQGFLRFDYVFPAFKIMDSEVEFRNCRFKNNQQVPVEVVGDSHVVFRDSRFEGNQYSLVYSHISRKNQVQYVELANCTVVENKPEMTQENLAYHLFNISSSTSSSSSGSLNFVFDGTKIRNNAHPIIKARGEGVFVNISHSWIENNAIIGEALLQLPFGIALQCIQSPTVVLQQDSFLRNNFPSNMLCLDSNHENEVCIFDDHKRGRKVKCIDYVNPRPAPEKFDMALFLEIVIPMMVACICVCVVAMVFFFGYTMFFQRNKETTVLKKGYSAIQ